MASREDHTAYLAIECGEAPARAPAELLAAVRDATATQRPAGVSPTDIVLHVDVHAPECCSEAQQTALAAVAASAPSRVAVQFHITDARCVVPYLLSIAGALHALPSEDDLRVKQLH